MLLHIDLCLFQLTKIYQLNSLFIFIGVNKGNMQLRFGKHIYIDTCIDLNLHCLLTNIIRNISTSVLIYKHIKVLSNAFVLFYQISYSVNIKIKSTLLNPSKSLNKRLLTYQRLC